MLVTVELRWLTAVMLVSIRLGVVFLLTPVFSLIGLPLNVRVLLVLALAATLVSGMGGNLFAAVPTAPGAMAVAALNELALGSLLAFALIAGFAAFQFAGRIMDIQLGFGVAALIDPTTRGQAPLRSLDPNDPRRQQKARRVFLESVLSWQFGDELLLDRGFEEMIAGVQEALHAHPRLEQRLARLLSELAR